jgi:hypothetical protein
VRKIWVLALAAAAAITFGAWTEGRSTDPVPRPTSYVVASTGDSNRVVEPDRSPEMTQGPRTPLPGTLPLLFVGSLLLGLAAAVRRTT